MVNLIERGMTVSSLENQFLTNESKTDRVNTEKRLYQMVDRFYLGELRSLSWQWLYCGSMSQVLFHAYIARWTSSGSKTVESRIWLSTNLESPSGRSDVLFFLPEVSGTRNCIIWMSTWTNWILLRRDAAIDIRKVVAQMNLHIYPKSLGKKVYNFLTHLERQ